jgi:hypothetical protein
VTAASHAVFPYLSWVSFDPRHPPGRRVLPIRIAQLVTGADAPGCEAVSCNFAGGQGNEVPGDVD